MKYYTAFAFALALMGFNACELLEGSGPARAKGSPAAFFTVSVEEVGTSFLVSVNNQSENSDGGTEDLAYEWDFEGKGSSTIRQPGDRVYSFDELGLSVFGDTATRRISLVVTEDDDPDRRSNHSETVIFELRL